MAFDRFLVVGARDTRSEHGKGWLRNREFEPKSNRHDTPPTFPIDLWPEVLRVLRPPQPRRPFLLLFHPALYARVLARRKAKRVEAFVRTFLGHLYSALHPYQPFTLRPLSFTPYRLCSVYPFERKPRNQ